MISKSVYLFLAVLLIFSCQEQTKLGSFDETGYTVTSISGSHVKELQLIDETGLLVEKGYVSNGLKIGNWTTYWQDGKKIKSVKHFVDGKLNGTSMKYNDRNQILEITNYLNDQLHGYHVVYSWARPVKEITYKLGKVHGEMKVYFDKNGKLQKTISFSNGVQDGPFRQYDFEGNLVLDYIYKNGEKVSGGPVAKSATSEIKE